MIEGFSQTLKFLAYTLQQSGITDVTPRMIIGLAELLDPSTRALINEVFRVEMVDKYGTVEADCIGWECPEHCGYHLNTDSLRLR